MLYYELKIFKKVAAPVEPIAGMYILFRQRNVRESYS